MNTKATFEQFVDMCNRCGWDNGINELEKMVKIFEDVQARYEVIGYKEQKKVKRLGKTLAREKRVIEKLKEYRLKNKL